MESNLAEKHQNHVAPQATASDLAKYPEIDIFSPNSTDLSPSIHQHDKCQDGHYQCLEAPPKKEHRRNTVRIIPLSKGKFAQVSPEDYEQVMQYKWMARLERGTTWYAVRDFPLEPGRKSRSKMRMHRFIMGLDGPGVDHKDGDGLNNTRENLRHATVGQNNCNVGKPSHGTSSPYKGVSWHPKAKKWQASIRFNRHQNYLGLFLDPAAAARAYDREARNLFGEFARPNFPELS